MLTPIEYSQDEKEIIKAKMSEKSFTHKSWSDEDILAIKESIKSHYHKVQKGVCPYCKQQLNSTHGRYWDIEHIIPRSHVPSFMFEPKNLCMSCVECNSEKSDKKVTSSSAKTIYPTKPQQYSIIHPHLDNYEEHLLVIEAGLFYYPLKPKGRKTVEVCGLNRFYEYAGFGNNGDIFQTIQALTAAASSVEDDSIKHKILGQITALALRRMVENTQSTD
ncbi:HNH endonuclease [Plesiomonas shigelloides]|uniref:HNH endonuclease n=1 Tax=Plesiomonas shigelloides TaxID=703 RepID=UPI00126206F9|nr:HNH endonuclease [Plesiomonas shigelloides]KAB7661756.1 HNH endonuclease [Plesiomonas shigelloides]